MGKTILMTGCSEGTGAYAAAVLKERGHRLFGVGKGGPDVNLDFRFAGPNDVARVYQRFAQETGEAVPDVVISNAAMGASRENSERDPHQDWEHILRVNLTLPYLFAQHLVRELASAQPGCFEDREAMHAHGYRLINVAGRSARVVSTDDPAFCASKAGLVALTENLAHTAWESEIPLLAYSLSPGGGPSFALRGEDREEFANLLVYLVEDAPPALSGHDIQFRCGNAA